MDGLGTFTPTIDLVGEFSISFRADPALNYGMNVPETFSGTILNRSNIGKTSDDLVSMWNEQYSDDQVGFSEN